MMVRDPPPPHSATALHIPTGLFLPVARSRLGWAHVEAMIVEGTLGEVRLIAIDENLARAALPPRDRA